MPILTRSRSLTLITLLASACAAPGDGRRPLPLTRPEASSYLETSRYDDVLAFLIAVDAASDDIALTTYGYTYEGRAMPLAIVGAPGTSAQDVRATGKTRIFVQGNIHAGEVEGKEAALWLLRSIALGERADWLEHVVLLVAPIYNADGNERVSVANRGAQHGPLGGMGQRHNAQDLDLNREGVKMESPEARSLARLLTEYDPHVALDLHTTNGSAHGYPLTYEVAGGPNVDPGLDALLRRELLPAVTETLRREHDLPTFWYGGPNREGTAWANDSDLYRPRYTHVYFGLRNMLGILSEAYSYATFEERIRATYQFVGAIVDWVAANGARVRAAKAAADARDLAGAELALACKLTRTADAVEILLADLIEERNPYVPDRPLRRLLRENVRPVTMAHDGTLIATETGRVPRAYVIPAPTEAQGRRMLATVLDRLDTHGIRHTTTSAELPFTGEHFRITSSQATEESYQGHKPRTLEGAWEPHAQSVAPGALVIPLDQPLARLAFLFLEPRSDDGFATWNLLDAALAADPAPEFFPILRTDADLR
ncbi:MAG: M14 family metallopeptidase [Planctomycetota bacterium]